MKEARSILTWLTKNGHGDFSVDEALIGGSAYDETGTPLPAETLEKSLAADAVLMGAIGGPAWDQVPFDQRPEAGLLGIRKEMGLFANLRPAVVFDELASASSLKKELVQGLDIMIVRELTGGIYFGKPAGIEQIDADNQKGYNTLVYTTEEISRIANLAFSLANVRGKKVCSVDKANVLEVMRLWRQEVINVHQHHSHIDLTHMYVDNAAMQLVRNPKQFDVIVTGNMFGDILSDCASMLTGSLGMLPSASLGEEKASGYRSALYEPVHGSAPDIAGQDKANPIAMILSLAMMLKYSFAMDDQALMVENAVRSVLAQGLRTADIMQEGCQQIGTQAMGAAIIQELKNA